jgi:hypothetical protein
MNMKLDDIRIEDIAHALSMKCRYTGHCREFLSISEHSVNVSLLVYKSLAKATLLHDGNEAYLPDIPSPVKQSGACQWLRGIEDEVQDMIYHRFDVPAIDYRELKTADIVMMAVEAERNMVNYATSNHWRWVREFAADHAEMLTRARRLVTGRDWRASENLFLHRWDIVK